MINYLKRWISANGSVESFESVESLDCSKDELNVIDIDNYPTKRWLVKLVVSDAQDMSPLVPDSNSCCNFESKVCIGNLIKFDHKELMVVVCKPVNEKDVELEKISQVSTLITDRFKTKIQSSNYKIIVTGYHVGGSIACQVAYNLKKQYPEKDISILTMNCHPYATIEQRTEMKGLFTKAKNLINFKRLALLCLEDKVVPISSPFDFQDKNISEFLGKIWELVSEVYLLKNLNYEKLFVYASVMFPFIALKKIKLDSKSLLIAGIAGFAYFIITQIISLFYEKDSFRFNFDGHLEVFIRYLISSCVNVVDSVSMGWRLMGTVIESIFHVLSQPLVNFIGDLYRKIKDLMTGYFSLSPIPVVGKVENDVQDYSFLKELFLMNNGMKVNL